MEKFFLIFQILVSGLLITLILLQAKGPGLGSTSRGSDLFRSKRGAEKIIFIATFVVGALFLGGAIINTLISLR